MRYVKNLGEQLSELTFQCPEGRYSSALRIWRYGVIPVAPSFSAPKGVIAVRYPDMFVFSPRWTKFQCPEGRYSSALRFYFVL